MGGLLQGGLTGDPETSIVGGGITGEEDTNVVDEGVTGDEDTNILPGYSEDNPVPGGGRDESSAGPVDWFADTFTGGPDTGGGGNFNLNPWGGEGNYVPGGSSDPEEPSAGILDWFGDTFGTGDDAGGGGELTAPKIPLWLWVIGIVIILAVLRPYADLASGVAD